MLVYFCGSQLVLDWTARRGTSCCGDGPEVRRRSLIMVWQMGKEFDADDPANDGLELS